jgi:beta-galactosidase
MKKIFSSALITVILTFAVSAMLNAQDSPRSRESFNDGWKFVKFLNASDESATTDKEPAGLEMPGYNDSSWRALDLPHDWAIEGPFSDTLENNTGLLPWKAIGWYRKHFKVNEADKDKQFFIDIDGAMAYAKVWLNGKFVGEWPYGYTSFRLDLTPYISVGKENVIAVRLDTKNWDSRWYPGAGIYRNVWLVKTSRIHVAHNGIFVTTPEIKKEKAIVSVLAEIESQYESPIPVTVKAAVYKLNGAICIACS